MAEEYQLVHHRGLQTIGVWGQHAATLKVGKLTLTQHTTDVADILTRASSWEAATSGLDAARDARDLADRLLHTLNVHAPDAIEGDLEEDDEYLDDLPDIRAIKMTNPGKTLERARKIIPLWTKINARHAAATPVEPPLQAKGTTLADFTALMETLAPALQEVENQNSDERKAAGALARATAKVDRQNKKWFIAWQGAFEVGSPERDALSQIDTGSPTPAPSPLVIATATPQAAGSFALAYTAGGGAHASALILQWQVVGVDADFAHDTAVNQAGQTVATGAATGASVKFRTKGTNSSGTTFGPLKTATAQ